MNATKTIYTDLPAIVEIPKEFVHKKGEIIVRLIEATPKNEEVKLKDFFGILEDFPERASQGNYEKREIL